MHLRKSKSRNNWRGFVAGIIIGLNSAVKSLDIVLLWTIFVIVAQLQSPWAAFYAIAIWIVRYGAEWVKLNRQEEK